MKFRFLGTGSAQGSPYVWGDEIPTPLTEYHKDKNYRLRACARLNDNIQIDCGPDNHLHMLFNAMSMRTIKHLFITHSHADHFCPAEVFDAKLMGLQGCKEHYLTNMYLTPECHQWLMEKFLPLLHPPHEMAMIRDAFVFNTFAFFEPFKVDNLTVIALRGNHQAFGENEYAANYLFEDEQGHSVLYATDTGYFLEETWQFLAGRTLKNLILEVTFGAETERGTRKDTHLNYHTLHEVVERLHKQGTITKDTPVYLTHINPDQGWSHDDFEAECAKSPFKLDHRVRWNGLRYGHRLKQAP